MIPASHLLCARLSAAIYETDPDKLAASVRALGCTPKALFVQPEITAYLVAANQNGAEMPVLIFQGTRVTEHTDIYQIWDDLDCVPVDCPVGQAAAGFYNPLAKLWPEIEAALPSKDMPIITTGHSLGGVRANLALGLALERGRMGYAISFGAPKGGDPVYWGRWSSPNAVFFRYVHERDFAPAWPIFSNDFVQPAQLLWLVNGGLVANGRATRDGVHFLDLEDHAIEKYIAAMTSFMGLQ